MFHKTPRRRVLFSHCRRQVGLLVFGVLSILLAVPLLFAQPAQAATNNTLNFQARLHTAGGAVVPDGYYNVEFKLYSASSGGSALWTETWYDTNGAAANNDFRVKVRNGYLTANLGSVTSFPAINWDQDLWLTMNIGGTSQTSPDYDGEMNPRLKLTGIPYAFKAGQLAKFNSTTGYTSTLQLQDPTGGNQNFIIPDQGAAGTYNLLTTAAAGAAYIQNTTTTQTANIAIQSASASSVGMTITGAGSQTADILQVKADGVTPALFSVSSSGAVSLRAASDSTTAFNLKNAAGANMFTVNTTNSSVGINLGSSTTPSLTHGGLQVAGAIKINAADASQDNFLTPGGATVGTAINIPVYNVGNYSQVLAVGASASSYDTARVLSLFDARTVAHQPTISVFNPNESQVFGLSWDGSNTVGLLKNTANQVGIQAGGTNIANFANASGTAVMTVSGSGGLLQVTNIDKESSGTLTIGGTTATALTLGRSGVTTTNAGAFTSSELLTASAGLTLSSGNLTQSGSGTVSTGTGTVSLNGDTTVASGKNLSVAQGSLAVTGASGSTALNVTSTSTGSPTVVLSAVASQTAHILRVVNATGNNALVVTGAGDIATSDAQLTIGGTTVSNNRVNLTGTINNSANSTVYGVQNQITYNVTTAGSVIHGNLNAVVVGASSASLSDIYSVAGRVDVASGYAGTITNAASVAALRPVSLNGVKIGSYHGFYAENSNSGSSGNSDNTSGTINNYGMRVVGGSAAAGVGGALNNYAGHFELSTGASSGTTNYGVYISGVGGGGGATNYAIYSSSTAASSIGGSLSAVGLNAGSGTLQGAGGLSATGTISLNATGSSNTSIGNSSGTLTLTSSNFTLSSAGVVAGLTGLTMASGNFLQSGSGNFTTGSGTVTLSGDTTVSSGKTFTAATGVLTSNLDVASAGPLTIGNTTATTTTVGRSGQTLSLPGTVGIGTTGPDRKLDVLDASNPQLRLSQADGTVYSDLQTDSNGYLIMTSTGNRISLGTSDTTATLLVLDTKTNAGDPTGVAGAMYYNSSSNSFRCYDVEYWRDCIQSPRSSYVYNQEFMSTGSGDYFDGTLITNSSGTGSGYGQSGASVASHPGIIRLSTGSTASGYSATWINDAGNIGVVLGAGDSWRHETVLRVPVLSTGAQQFTARTGFGEGTGSTDGADSCIFKYNEALNGGRWQGSCSSNSTTSTCDTTVTVAAGTWYRLTILVNAAGTSADFRINGVSRCTVTTNIPGSARQTSIQTTVSKSVGSTSRDIDVDYIGFESQFGTSR